MDCEDCSGAGGISHGFFEGVGETGEPFEGFIESPALTGAVEGVLDLDGGSRSPSRTNVSSVLSILPLNPFKTVEFRLSFLKPISRSWPSFLSHSSTDRSEVLEFPNMRAGFPFLGGGGPSSSSRLALSFWFWFSRYTLAAASRFAFDDMGKMDDADLNPNLLVFCGGGGRGCSSESALPVLR